MTRKIILKVASVFTLALFSCTPAAETEEHMYAVAYRTTDSIQKWLDSSLNDPAKTLSEGIRINTVTIAPAQK
jgi:hypothetical protein